MIRPDFRPRGVASDEVLKRHIFISSAVPVLKEKPPHDIPLAVVGGGVSALKRLEELKAWEGHIWAINQGAQWLASHGRSKDVWMFSISPTPRIATYLENVERAILASQCHPDVFQGLAERGAEVGKFHLFEGSGPASVNNTVIPAAFLGYQKVTFFGCEGSFNGETYFYRKEHKPEQMVIRSKGVDYVTSTDLFVTTEQLAKIVREYPQMFSEKSGGLLRAMVEDDQWGVVAWSEALRDRVDPQAVSRYEALPTGV